MVESRKRLKSADKPLRLLLVLLLCLSIIGPTRFNQTNISISSENEIIDSTLLQIEKSEPRNPDLHLSETNPPVIDTHPANVTISEEILGNKLKWKISDPEGNENLFDLYRNGDLVQSGNYTWNAHIVVILDGLTRGIHNFTIVANDTDGNFVVDTTYATVTDDKLPIFDMIPLDFNVTEDSTGNNITWKGSDLHPLNYRVVKNTTEVDSGLWNSSEDISINIDGLPFGTYSYTITIYDDSGNSASDNVLIQVVDITSPVVLLSPSNITFPFTTVGNNLIVNATDKNPDSYQIFQDNVFVSNGTWNNAELITWNLDYLIQGNYTFSILLIDQFSNNFTIKIDVFVILLKDTLLPQFIINSIVREGDYETIQSNWADIYNNGIAGANITISLYSNQTLIATTYYSNHSDTEGNFDIIFDYDGLSVGGYYWEVSFNAENFVSQVVTLDFTIIPHNYAIIASQMSELTQGENYEFFVTVIYANPTSSIILNSFVAQTGVVSGIELELFMEIILLDGTSSNISRTSISDNDGKATFNLNIFETSLISSITSITLESTSTQFGNSITDAISSQNFPVIITSNISQVSSDNSSAPTTSNTDTKLNENNSNPISEFIIISLAAGIVILFILLRKIISSRKQKRINLESEYNISMAEIDGILSVAMVMLTSTSGIPLYERKLRSMGIDTILLSGVTTAISSLLQEANDQQIFGLEIMENQGLSITSHKGKYSSLVFISSNSLPMMILSQMILAHESIEKKYGNQLAAGLSVVLSTPSLNKMFNDHNLKLDLSGDLEIDLFTIDTFSSNGNNKIGANSLIEILIDIEVRQIELPNVKKLIEIYKEKGYQTNYIANFILNAYNEGLIKSKIK